MEDQENLETLRAKLDRVKAKYARLREHHPGDDDPYGVYYTVREQRVSLSRQRQRLQEKIKNLKNG